jgi:hypothetical protein
MRPVAATLLVALATAVAVTAADARAAGSRVIRVSATLIRVGDLHVDADPTFGAAIDAFGPASSCRRIELEDGAIVRWNAIGLRIVTATLGGISGGRTACTYRGMPIATIKVTGRPWKTSLGLRVGDATAKLRRLYPRARYQAQTRGESLPGDSFVLVTPRTACLGDCGAQRFVNAPRLIAKMHAGRVVAFVLPVGAQGE